MQRFCLRFSLLGVLAILLTTSSVGAQNKEVVTYHDLSVMSKWALGKMQVNGAMGQLGSFAIAELPDGLRGNPHHHNQEQIVLGLGGMTEMTIDGTTHRLGVRGAVVTPPNTQHSNNNGGPGAATFIEFQSVQRTDWFPPHQKFVPTVAAAPAPVPVPQGRQVFSDFAIFFRCLARRPEWRAFEGHAGSDDSLDDLGSVCSDRLGGSGFSRHGARAVRVRPRRSGADRRRWQPS